MRSFLDKQSSSEYPTERTSAVLLDEKKTKIEPCAQRKTAAFSSHLMIKYSINKAALTRRVLLGHLITYILCNLKKTKALCFSCNFAYHESNKIGGVFIVPVMTIVQL